VCVWHTYTQACLCVKRCRFVVRVSPIALTQFEYHLEYNTPVCRNAPVPKRPRPADDLKKLRVYTRYHLQSFSGSLRFLSSALAGFVTWLASKKPLEGQLVVFVNILHVRTGRLHTVPEQHVLCPPLGTTTAKPERDHQMLLSLVYTWAQYVMAE
jgi:hypothetical protein